jgi:hypothetical protein
MTEERISMLTFAAPGAFQVNEQQRGVEFSWNTSLAVP